ncbi:MAG TPA: sulfite reductase subunit alpha [Fibrobacteria bacterium]|nr:sulfite reductase subunit alpha [Fibrobacteria bacterium]
MNSPVLPETAPFSTEQRMWLNGFLAGLSNLGAGAGAAAATPALPDFSAPVASAVPVLVLYGSQSGTAEGLSQALADKLKAKAFARGSVRAVPRVAGLEKFKDIAWADETTVLVITSTWGDGDMPDNAVAFWEWFKTAAAPSLSHVSFAVLGLGDHSYSRFCQAGKNLDKRFAELGAKRLLSLCECGTDYEAKADFWMDETLAALESVISANPAALSAAPAALSAASAALSAASAALSAAPAQSAEGSLANGSGPNGHAANGSAAHNGHAVPSLGTAATPAKPAPAYSRKNPFLASLLENHPLNAKGSAKDTRHISISLLGSGLEYRVGDALGIVPRNCYELADRIILALNCLGNEKVQVEGGETLALRTALISKLDLRRASERLLVILRETAHNQKEKRRLTELLAEDGLKAKPYLADRDLLDVLEDFPHTRLDAQQLAGTLAKLAPRLYSISSSPKENPGEVHLTVGVVRYQAGKRLRRGVASTFLAERVPLGMTLPVFVQPAAHFGLPAEPGKPIIMVGPGTGIAPFRAFLQERRFLGDTGKNWLFFGDQRRRYDFLYSEEFVAMQASGFLSRLDLAFSRDQEEKVYVQTRMLERSKELFAWLEEGAYFYVCGDAKRMAKDVDEALQQVIAKESGKGPEEARAYLARMKEEKRYQRDVY